MCVFKRTTMFRSVALPASSKYSSKIVQYALYYGGFSEVCWCALLFYVMEFVGLLWLLAEGFGNDRIRLYLVFLLSYYGIVNSILLCLLVLVFRALFSSMYYKYIMLRRHRGVQICVHYGCMYILFHCGCLSINDVPYLKRKCFASRKDVLLCRTPGNALHCVQQFLRVKLHARYWPRCGWGFSCIWSVALPHFVRVAHSTRRPSCPSSGRTWHTVRPVTTCTRK